MKERLLLNLLDEITNKYNEVLAENKNLLDKISYKAEHDVLTGVYNRAFFEKEIIEYLNKEIPICLVFIDIDNFKYVNDTFGHEMGDKILIMFAKILKDFFKGGDLIARYGGDEFVVAMIDCEKEAIKGALEKLLKKIKENFSQYNISISIGAAFYPQEAKTYESLLKLADERMYEIKKSGKDGVNIGSGSED